MCHAVRSLNSLLRSRHAAAALVTGLLAIAACGDASGPRTPMPFDISGTLAGPQLASLPAGSRVVVLWVVTSGSPDYTYIYGQGTIDAANGRFSVRLPDAPPAAALNAYGVGVGIPIVIPPGVTLPNGRVTDDAALEAAALGAAGNYAVIYTAGARPAGFTGIPWIDAFPLGYGVGRGIDLSGSFDGFEPVGSTTIEMIIDDIDNIDFVNWT